MVSSHMTNMTINSDTISNELGYATPEEIISAAKVEEENYFALIR